MVGDGLRLGQVLVNLLSNAVKFTEAGAVSVDARRVPPDGGGPARVRIAVRDTGIGIEPERLARLFQPFEQAEASTSRRFGGTGLGLAISKRLVELMDGGLSAESVPGQGSTFVVDLPLRAAPRPAAVPAPAGPADAVRTAGPMRLLVAEDNPVNQRVTQRMLKRLGYDADLVENGREAIEAARPPGLRRRADGRADAGARRAGGDAPHPRARCGPAPGSSPSRPMRSRTTGDSASTPA